MVNIPKIAFSTFADGNFGVRAAGRRLVEEAKNSELFTLGIYPQNLDLIYKSDQKFKKRNQDFIETHRRGLGNYIWKPKVLLNLLAKVKTNEFVCYLDSGCQLNLNPKSLKRFAEYIDLVDSFDGLFMQLEHGAFGAPDLSDEAWTNKVTLDALDPSGTNRKSAQIQAGILLMKKNSITIELAENWLKICEAENYVYLMEDDSNLFLGRHRFDQSIFSLITKDTGMKYIPDETYWAPDWSQGINFPIWAMRNRSGGNAYRRNLFDLSKMGVARISRI